MGNLRLDLINDPHLACYDFCVELFDGESIGERMC